ncbi:DNA primase DnaG [Candidatus Bathyarchaeota archaeon]|jgi:DNA primase|nr:DNA primase DnaG [Candidatus Bathyarchaeota archaeon]
MGAYQAIAPKYLIRASYQVEGVVEKSDVIGALFGQTEGLFGPDLDLHELQKTGRIGRIEISLETRKDKTNGDIVVPCSLDKPVTALIAAAVESVDRVGPCGAKVSLLKIEDVREKRRTEIIERAKSILHKWVIEEAPTIEQVSDEIAKAITPSEVTSYGSERLAAGPDVSKSNSIIIVEGRADVINLLRAGLKNAIACEGTNVSDTVVKLSKSKEVTALLDGDRGGDIILEALLRIAKVDYVARAPSGREVEELSPKEILHVLEQKISVNELQREKVHPRQRRAPRPEETEAEKPASTIPELIPETEPNVSVPDALTKAISDLQGSLEAVTLDIDLNVIEKMPVSELAAKLQKLENVHTIVFDGVITQRLVDVAAEKGIKRIIGDRISGVAKRPVDIELLTVTDVMGPEKN